MAETIKSRLDKPRRSFAQNRDAVYELLEFDTTVIEIAVRQLTTTEERNRRTWENQLKNTGQIHKSAKHDLPPHLSIQNAIQVLQGIRSHRSLKPKYDLMINQCVVLLVAHFASGSRSVFREAVRIAIETDCSDAVMNFTVQARAGDLYGLSGSTVDLIAEQIVSDAGMSFQDMKSIGRALTKYFEISIPRDRNVDNIVVAHASRHLIVHSGDVVDKQFLKQVRSAEHRSIKKDITEGEVIQFSAEEVHAVGGAMTAYLDVMSAELARVLRGHA